MAKKALVFLADGFEEVEAVTPIDYLRRVGIEVCTASLGAETLVSGSHGIRISADTTLEELRREGKLEASLWEAVILPGGLPGADNLAASKECGAFLRGMAAAGKWVCAICASPALVLAPLGLLEGKRFTCYPGMEEKVSGAEWSPERTVVDKSGSAGAAGLITGRGAGSAGEFAIAIISCLLNEAEGKALAEKVLLK